MKLPNIAQVRIPVTVAIIVFEIVGFTHIYKQHLVNPIYLGYDMNRHIFFSQTAICYLIAYLWNDWFQQRGIWFFEVFLVITFGFASIFMFAEGDSMSALFCVVIALGSTAWVMPRLLRPWRKVIQACDPGSVDVDCGETALDANDHPIRYCAFMFLATFLFLWALWLRFGAVIPKWIFAIFTLPALLTSLMVYLTRLKGRRNIDNKSATTIN